MTSPRDDQQTGGAPQTNIRRHLLFGLALALAFGSIYAGVLGGGPILQWGLGVSALIVVIVAMATGPTKPR
jgi:hypothetical protein